MMKYETKDDLGKETEKILSFQRTHKLSTKINRSIWSKIEVLCDVPAALNSHQNFLLLS